MKKWININERELTDSGTVERTVVRCIVENNIVQCIGSPNKIASLATAVQDPNGQVITAESGEAFLDALSFAHRGSYIFASDVKEGEEITDPPLTA
jgi:hypothetical protein